MIYKKSSLPKKFQMNETKLPSDILRKIFQLLGDEDIEKISSSVCNDSFWIQRINLV